MLRNRVILGASPVNTDPPGRTRAASASVARDDAGTSLAELLVTLVLMGFVLAGAYGLHAVVSKTSESSRILAESASTLGAPLEFMSRIVMQARSLAVGGVVNAPNGASVTVPSTVEASPDEFHLAVATDRVPFDGSWELNYFHIDESTPSILLWESWTFDDSNNAVGNRRGFWQMSSTVNNRTVGLPMLEYYGGDGSTRLTAPLDIASDLQYVSISLAAPTPDGGWSKDSRFVTLRN